MWSKSWELVSCTPTSRMVVSSHLAWLACWSLLLSSSASENWGDGNDQNCHHLLEILIMILLKPWGHRRWPAGGLWCCRHLALADCLSLQPTISVMVRISMWSWGIGAYAWYQMRVRLIAIVKLGWWFWWSRLFWWLSPIVHSSSLASLYSITK